MLYAAPAESGGSPLPLILIVLLFVAMYFMIIRPQQKRRREAERMQSALAVGDKVVTIGGLHATVAGLDADTVDLEVSPGVTVRYARPAIGQVLPKTEASPAVPAAEEPAVEKTD